MELYERKINESGIIDGPSACIIGVKYFILGILLSVIYILTKVVNCILFILSLISKLLNNIISFSTKVRSKSRSTELFFNTFVGSLILVMIYLIIINAISYFNI